MKTTTRRTVRLQTAPSSRGPGLLHITQAGKVESYRLSYLAGMTWRVAKVGEPASTYRVNLAQGACGCRGFQGHGHCRHLGGLEKLAARKLI